MQGWCEKTSQYTFFKSFVRGIRQDFEAVYQAIISSSSSGQAEGQINRLKNIKLQMYGRTSFELLRIRVSSDSSLFSPKVAQKHGEFFFVTILTMHLPGELSF